jgi:hypothetical protein
LYLFLCSLKVCEDCADHLLDQWNRFEEEEVTHADRNYTLRKRAAPVIDTTTFVCYIWCQHYKTFFVCVTEGGTK